MVTHSDLPPPSTLRCLLGIECPRCQHRELISSEELEARRAKAQDEKHGRVLCANCKRTTGQVRTFLDNRSARRFMAEYR